MSRTLLSLEGEQAAYIAQRAAILASKDSNRISEGQRLQGYINILTELIAVANGDEAALGRVARS